MSQRKSGIVAIEWPTMFYACMDVYCTCGDQFHIDVYDSMKQSAQYVRCPHCEAVYRCGSEVPLVVGDINYERLSRPNAFVQSKGTKLHGTAHCLCGHDDRIERDFAYKHECTGCGAKYQVDPHIEMIPLSADDVGALPADRIVTEDTRHDEELLTLSPAPSLTPPEITDEQLAAILAPPRRAVQRGRLVSILDSICICEDPWTFLPDGKPESSAPYINLEAADNQQDGSGEPLTASAVPPQSEGDWAVGLIIMGSNHPLPDESPLHFSSPRARMALELGYGMVQRLLEELRRKPAGAENHPPVAPSDSKEI